jgi:hypothetical protein
MGNLIEKVDHPEHYNQGIEAIEYINSWNMGFNEGNIVKYITRYQFKEGLEDLKKAQWYLDNLISQIETSKKSKQLYKKNSPKKSKQLLLEMEKLPTLKKSKQ